MSGSEARECALDGCPNTFAVERGRPDKRFCCSAHRKFARRQRLEETLAEELDAAASRRTARELVVVGVRERAGPAPAPATSAPAALPPTTTRHKRLVREPDPTLRMLLLRRRLRRTPPPPHVYTGGPTRVSVSPVRWLLAPFRWIGDLVVIALYLDRAALRALRRSRSRPSPAASPPAAPPPPARTSDAPPVPPARAPDQGRTPDVDHAAGPPPAPAGPPETSQTPQKAPVPPAPAPRLPTTPWVPELSAPTEAPAPVPPRSPAPAPASTSTPFPSPVPARIRTTPTTTPATTPATTAAPAPERAVAAAAPARGSWAWATQWARTSTPMPETLRSALDSLAASKLRSALTMVGIVIGVAAVIMLVGIGNGMQADFDRQFSLLANQITVTKAKTSGGGAFASRNLTDHDVELMRDPRQAPDVASVSPSVNGDAMLTVGQAQVRAKMFGVTENYLELLDRQVTLGRWLNQKEVDKGERVAVLGEDTVSALWGAGVPPDQVVGAVVRVEHTNFKVAGVLKSDGQNDNVVMVPFLAARNFLVGDNAGKVDQIVIKSTGVTTVGKASSQIVDILDQSHRVRKPAARDYNVLTYASLLKKSQQFITFLSLFIVAIAAVSLLVGGIGVANIMLVAVTERTREIGIRKAIGAKRSTVLAQFLTEAVLLTSTGGLIGVGIGLGGALGSKQVLPKLVDDFPPPILSVPPVVVAFAISAVIGVVAGSYPAYRAARMRPIDALRFE